MCLQCMSGHGPLQKPSTWGRRVKCGGRTAERFAEFAQAALPWICHLFQHLAQASPPVGVRPTLCGNLRTAPDSNDDGECWGLGLLASHFRPSTGTSVALGLRFSSLLVAAFPSLCRRGLLFLWLWAGLAGLTAFGGTTRKFKATLRCGSFPPLSDS